MFDYLASRFLNWVIPARSPTALPGIVLGRMTSPPHRREHALAIGKTGTGKTHACELLAFEIAKRGEGLAVFDFHGDLSLSLTRRLLSLPNARRRLMVLDPSHPRTSRLSTCPSRSCSTGTTDRRHCSIATPRTSASTFITTIFQMLSSKISRDDLRD